MNERLADTWFSRDRPVLFAILRVVDSGAAADVREIGHELGLTPEQMYTAMQALIAEGLVDDRYGPMGPILNVSGDARRELGTWPSVDKVALDMAAAFEQAAESEQDSNRKKALLSAAETVRSVGVQLFTKYLENKAGL